jgi:hypothetical protein
MTSAPIATFLHVMVGPDPAIDLSISQDFEMDGRLKGGHDRGVG